MSKTGKSLEQLVKAIQITLKDCPNTSIENNVKMNDISGVTREIDVLVTTSVQSNSINYKIAFECKEYKSKVTVSIVEAFIAKCMDIPEINKGIMVSSNGFSDGAIKKAKQHGIMLCGLNQIDIDKALFGDKAFLAYPEYNINEQFQIEFRSNEPISDDAISPTLETLYDKNGTPIPIYNYVLSFLYNIHTQTMLVKSFLEKGKRTIDYTYSIKPPQNIFYVDNKGNSHIVSSITGNVNVNFKLLETSTITGKEMKQGKTQISAIEYGFEKTEAKLVFISTNTNKKEYFIKDKDNNYLIPIIRLSTPTTD